MIIKRIVKIFCCKKEFNPEHKTVLIIDDDSKNRKFLSMVVRKKGYNILAEQDEKNGCDAAKDKLPDLMIIGAVIARKKSIDLCGRLKSDSKTKRIPILVFADSRENIKSIEYYDRGVDYFITSPIAESDLLKQVEILIRE